MRGMSRHALLRVLIVALAVILTNPGQLAAAGPPFWPSEQEEQLQKVDRRLLDTQKKLFRARLGGNRRKAAKLKRRFESLQEKRLELLRATGQL